MSICIKCVYNNFKLTVITAKLRTVFINISSYLLVIIKLYIYNIYIYRVSQEECARFREGVPYAKV